MHSFEGKLPFPLSLGHSMVVALGRHAARQFYGVKGLDNAVVMQRERVLNSLEAEIDVYSVRRLPHVDGINENQEAAERAALPELKALLEHVETEGPTTHAECEAMEPAAPPDPLAAEILMQIVEHHEPRTRRRQS